jgi:hypothetical protein
MFSLAGMVSALNVSWLASRKRTGLREFSPYLAWTMQEQVTGAIFLSVFGWQGTADITNN